MNRDSLGAAAVVKALACERASTAVEADVVRNEPVDSNAGATAHQRPLYGLEAEPSLVTRDGGSQPRLFFPCNREDALRFLSGLCVSPSFPDSSVRLAMQGEGLALVDDGLRLSEETLVCEGRPELFPVLIEVGLRDAETARRTLEHGHIVRLVFRTQDEADAFRYRPVDEFDTETFVCTVDAKCFGLVGASRFRLRAADDSEAFRTAAMVDRVLGGINCMLALGDVDPACRRAIASFVVRDGNEEGGTEGVGLTTVCKLITGSPSGEGHGYPGAIVRAFANAEASGPLSLLDVITSELLPGGSDQNRAEGIEVRWLETARGVTENRIALTGDRLSDEKLVFLRAALLALVADSVEALIVFRRAEKPSGPRVTSAAAFLVGLKQGLAGTSWRVKSLRARCLSAAAGALLRAFSEPGKTIDGCVSLVEWEDEKFSFLRVLVDGVQLAEWTAEKQRAPDEIEAAWEADFVRQGYAVAGRGTTQYSWRVTLPRGISVEVAHCAIGASRFPSFRWRPAEHEKLRKRRAIDAAFRAGGRLWYPRHDGEGRFYLCCELPVLPPWRDLGLIETALREAIGECVASSKPSRKWTEPVASK